MTKQNLVSAIFLSGFVLLALAGCNATNDNPVSAEQMHNIRQKESSDRANFHPSGTPTPNTR
jgi:hypothetical protein